MTTLPMQEAVKDFLGQKRIAVVGVSRGGDLPANAIYKKLREQGYTVFAVNPNATTVEGDPSYPNLAAIPDGVDAVMAAATPAVTEQVMRDCAELGIKRVWIHQSLDGGSFSQAAFDYGQAQGLQIIPGACPMMYCEPVDFGHRCMRWFLGVTGKLPQ
jgi:uncharacterized protein